MSDYEMIYLVLEVFCGAQAVVMAAKMTSDIGYSNEVRTFHCLSLCLIVEIVAEGLWIVCAGLDGAARVLLNLSCAADLLCTGYTVYFWYRFMDTQVTPREALIRRPKVVNQLWALPIGVMTVLDGTSPFTGLTFTLTKAGVYYRGPLFAVHALCCFFYAVPVVYLIAQSWKQQHIDRQDFTLYLFFPTIIVVGGILQIAYSQVAFSTVAFTFGMFILFNSLQRRQINTDALTRLNNRASAMAYLKGRIERAEGEPFYLFMADVDQFKGINDHYGHIMCDEALVLVADTLRDLAKDYRTLFISRYGGDEFLFTISENEVDPQQLIQHYGAALKTALDASGYPFRFTMSIGYALADTDGLSQSTLINQADQGMYGRKKR